MFVVTTLLLNRQTDRRTDVRRRRTSRALTERSPYRAELFVLQKCKIPDVCVNQLTTALELKLNSFKDIAFLSVLFSLISIYSS